MLKFYKVLEEGQVWSETRNRCEGTMCRTIQDDGGHLEATWRVKLKQKTVRKHYEKLVMTAECQGRKEESRDKEEIVF